MRMPRRLAGMVGGAVLMAQMATAGGTAPDEALESREAKMAGTALAEENAQLRLENEQLAERVHGLTVELAGKAMELDLARQAGSGGEVAGSAGKLEVTSIRVIEVNEELNLVVLDAGRKAGLRPGMVFAVVRDRTVVARVRAVDVRDRLTGATIESKQADENPRRQDRVIVAQ